MNSNFEKGLFGSSVKLGSAHETESKAPKTF